MNRIEKGKKWLVGISITIIVLSLVFQGVGIMLTVFGGKGLATASVKAGAIVELVIGIIMILLGLVGVGFGIAFTWTGAALKATNGSVAEDNLGKGTVNMKKCPYCGTEIAGEETFCANCGNSLAETKTCPSCGTKVSREAKACSNCGKEL